MLPEMSVVNSGSGALTFLPARYRASNRKRKTMSMQFEKTPTGATPWFGGSKPAGVIGQDTGRSNSAPSTGPAGGEISPSHQGPRTNSVGDSPVRR
jgi:hypothetical protein